MLMGGGRGVGGVIIVCTFHCTFQRKSNTHIYCTICVCFYSNPNVSQLFKQQEINPKAELPTASFSTLHRLWKQELKLNTVWIAFGIIFVVVVVHLFVWWLLFFCPLNLELCCNCHCKHGKNNAVICNL